MPYSLAIGTRGGGLLGTPRSQALQSKRILGIWTTNRACKCLSQQLWPVLEPILLFLQFGLWSTTIRWRKMTWHKMAWHKFMTSLMGIFCAYSMNLFHMIFWQKMFSQNLSTNSTGWQKLLSACFQWNHNVETRLWGTPRQNKNQQSFVLACKTVKTNLSLFPYLSLSHTHHITGDNELWHKLEYQYILHQPEAELETDKTYF